MKNQLDQIKIMSNTLERSGFTEEQPVAIIETVAVAIETFGVTPEILDDRINRVMDFVREQVGELKAQIADVRTEGRKQYGELKAQIADVRTEGGKQYGELKAQIADVRTEGRKQYGELKAQIADVRTEGRKQYGELKAQIADVRTEEKEQYRELRTEIADVKSAGKEQVSTVRDQLQDFKVQANSQFEILMAKVTAHSVEIKGIQQSIDGLKQGMLDHQRSMFRIMMTFMVAFLAATLGVFGVLVQQLVPG